MPSAAVLSALQDVERAQARLRAVLLDEADVEKPVPVKVAAYRYGVSERQMRRMAEAGLGVKRRNRWFVYPSRLLLPRVDD